MKKLCIIADDLTGATDTGVQFSKFGLSTLVVFDYVTLKDLTNDAETISINAETRKMDSEGAYRRVREIARLLGSIGFKRLYKKIDSTLRGHPAKEIEALLDETGQNLAFIVPSYPANGRTMENGYLYIKRNSPEEGGQPFPIGFVPGLLERDIKRPIALIELSDVRLGVSRLRQKINELKVAGRQIFVIDAVTDEDLANIALAIKDMAETSVVAGSAGLAAQLPNAWRMIPEEPAQQAGQSSVLFLAGTCNPVTAEQIKVLQQQNAAQLVIMSSQEIIGGNAGGEIARVTAVAREYLRAGNTTVIAIDTLLQSKEESYQLDIVMSNAKLIAESFGQVAMQLSLENLVTGVVVTGGDTAVNVFNAMGAQGIILGSEILPGIPWGTLIGGRNHGLRVITKAGGFGDKDSFSNIVSFLTKT
ncbi:four-carbon acid sugar kinase family protein [Desulfotomaculum nigrificans]|uniref:four-carbon acid sugar kinase family protein n=1 Tax=Desulfotomaculum nigrificans TaxID=1565 RepID=UPI0001FADE24|nr:four-carbon acid sugar kinase family protein [Desulfotomaculum nigrificans]